MSLCMCIVCFICLCMGICLCMHICMRVCMDTCMYICMACIYVCIFYYWCVLFNMYIKLNIYPYICMRSKWIHVSSDWYAYTLCGKLANSYTFFILKAWIILLSSSLFSLFSSSVASRQSRQTERHNMSAPCSHSQGPSTTFITSFPYESNKTHRHSLVPTCSVPSQSHPFSPCQSYLPEVKLQILHFLVQKIWKASYCPEGNIIQRVPATRPLLPSLLLNTFDLEIGSRGGKHSSAVEHLLGSISVEKNVFWTNPPTRLFLHLS